MDNKRVILIGGGLSARAGKTCLAYALREHLIPEAGVICISEAAPACFYEPRHEPSHIFVDDMLPNNINRGIVIVNMERNEDLSLIQKIKENEQFHKRDMEFRIENLAPASGNYPDGKELRRERRKKQRVKNKKL